MSAFTCRYTPQGAIVQASNQALQGLGAVRAVGQQMQAAAMIEAAASQGMLSGEPRRGAPELAVYHANRRAAHAAERLRASLGEGDGVSAAEARKQLLELSQNAAIIKQDGMVIAGPGWRDIFAADLRMPDRSVIPTAGTAAATSAYATRQEIIGSRLSGLGQTLETTAREAARAQAAEYQKQLDTQIGAGVQDGINSIAANFGYEDKDGKGFCADAQGTCEAAANWLISETKILMCKADPTCDDCICDNEDAIKYTVQYYAEYWGTMPSKDAMARVMAPVGGNSRPFSKATMRARVESNGPAGALPLKSRDGSSVPGAANLDVARINAVLTARRNEPLDITSLLRTQQRLANGQYRMLDLSTLQRQTGGSSSTPLLIGAAAIAALLLLRK